MTARRRTRPHDGWARYCDAWKRQSAHDGETCRRPAGWGATHAGVGRCKLRGGARGYTHGRYSRFVREHLLPAVRRQMADYSITILRARIHDDDRLNDVLCYVLEQAEFVGYPEVDDDEAWRPERRAT